MQLYSINNSHAKVCRTRPMAEVNLEHSVNKQSICSFLLDHYHRIQVQGLSNLVWVLHSRTKCSLCSQISCLPMNVGQLQPLVSRDMWQCILAGIPVGPCWLRWLTPLLPRNLSPHSDCWKSLQKQDSHLTKPGHVQKQICHAFIPKQDCCRW